MTARHEQITPGIAEEVAAGFAALVPTQRSKRLILRAISLADFDAFTNVVTGPRGLYWGGEDMSREDAWYDFANLSACWMLHGHGGWAIEAADDATLLGFVVLNLEPGDQDVELGYLLLEDATGQGFATEAATAARDWAFDALELPTLVSYIAAENTASIAVCERLGGTQIAPPEDKSHAVTYRHTNPKRRLS